jgi:hypothetical protein
MRDMDYKINDRTFFINKEVVILNIIPTFQLAEVRYVCSFTSFMVDVNALSETADESSSLSIKLLGGLENDTRIY